MFFLLGVTYSDKPKSAMFKVRFEQTSTSTSEVNADNVPKVNIDRSAGDEICLVSELERKDLEAQCESAMTVVDVVLADDVFACVQKLIESVELNAVLLDSGYDARRTADVDDVRLMYEQVLRYFVHV